MNGGTRLITLGISAGPPPRAHRAQSCNLLTVNGTHYVIDAGDGVARRLAKAGINVREIGTIFMTHPTTITRPVSGRCCRLRGIKIAPNQSTFMVRPGQKRWSRPLCSISTSARRSELPTEVAAYR